MKKETCKKLNMMYSLNETQMTYDQWVKHAYDKACAISKGTGIHWSMTRVIFADLLRRYDGDVK